MVALRSSSVGGARARELAQPAQRHLDVARADFGVAREILELALVPHLDGAAVPAFLLADAHARRIVAVGPIGRGAAGADPLVAALVALLLFREALLQLLHDLFPAAKFLDFLLVLVAEMQVADEAQPLLRDFRRGRVRHQVEALEDMAEDLIEAVEVALVLHQRRRATR